MDNAIVDSRNVIDDFKHLSTDRIRALYDERSLPYIVGVESLKGTLNLGTIIRTSNCMGASRVIYYGKKRYDPRSAVGSANYFPVEYKTLDHIQMLKDQYLVIGIDCNIPEVTVDYNKFSFPKKSLLLFGSEECGLSKEAKDLVDVFLTIPMVGSVRSLNVSVAASIVMAKYVEQHAR
jgi:tRNA G18 (ribose-2'-O)-methylase SpoU